MSKPTLAALVAAFLILSPAAASAGVKPGKYEGKVAAGYGAPQFALQVKRNRITELVARMFWSCNGQPQSQTVVVPEKPIKISSSGTFKAKVSSSYGGIGSETIFVSGVFRGAKVTGKIRSRYIGSGEHCDTQERKFSARRT